MNYADKFHIYLGLESGETFTYKTKTSHEIYIRYGRRVIEEDREWVVCTYRLNKEASSNMEKNGLLLGGQCVIGEWRELFDVAVYFPNEKITSAVEFIEQIATEAEF